MDRNQTIYRKPLHEQDLTGLSDLCANVARNVSADRKQGDMAHALRVEWVTLNFNGSLNGDRAEAENSLKKRMQEFLTEIPIWMLSGV
jgi:hypothetical protein